jgi:ParB-like chromosome segregation protein Spo0J
MAIVWKDPSKLERHPLNDLPEMNGREFDFLKASIKENGFDQYDPIVLYESKVLDGWNRVLAAKELKHETVPCWKGEFVNDKAAKAYIAKINIATRQLTSDQHRIRVALAWTESVKQGKQAASAISAEVKKIGKSERTIRDDAAWVRNNPKEAKAVAAGEMSLTAAKKQAATKQKSGPMKTKVVAKRATETTKSGNASVPIPMTLEDAYEVLKRVYENASKKTPDAKKTESSLRKIEELIARFRKRLNEAAE